jgi:hypothetical protein
MYAIYAIFLTSKQFVSDYVNEKYYMPTDKFRYQFLRFVNPLSPTSLGKLCDGCTNSTYQMTMNALRIIFFVTSKTVSSSSMRIFIIVPLKRLKASKIRNFMREITKFLDKLVLGGKNCGRRIHFR